MIVHPYKDIFHELSFLLYSTLLNKHGSPKEVAQVFGKDFDNSYHELLMLHFGSPSSDLRSTKYVFHYHRLSIEVPTERLHSNIHNKSILLAFRMIIIIRHFPYTNWGTFLMPQRLSLEKNNLKRFVWTSHILLLHRSIQRIVLFIQQIDISIYSWRIESDANVVHSSIGDGDRRHLLQYSTARS